MKTAKFYDSSTFQYLWNQYKEKKKELRYEQLRISVTRLSFDEFSRLYGCIAFSENSNLSVEQSAFHYTKLFLRLRQDVIIFTNGFNLFQEICKKYCGEITDEDIYQLKICQCDYHQIKSEWYWRYRNEDYTPDNEKISEKLYEHFTNQHNWIFTKIDFWDYITIYKLSKLKNPYFEFDGKKYEFKFDMNFSFIKYCNIHEEINKIYNKKYNELKSEVNFYKKKKEYWENEYYNNKDISIDNFHRYYEIYNQYYYKLKNLEKEFEPIENFHNSLMKVIHEKEKEEMKIRNIDSEDILLLLLKRKKDDE